MTANQTITTKTPTQCQRILDLLQAGERVTNYQLHVMGINASTTRIKELRERGYNIVTTKEPFINQFGKKTKIAVYTLVSTGGEDSH